MDNARWEQIKSIFSAAMDHPAAERTAYLDRACVNDPDLRNEVESLLNKRTQDVIRTGGAAQAIAEGSTATSPFAPLTERPGSVIGQYKLLQQIGEGGFGTVFLAEQSKPVRRRVALKIIKLGMDTKSIIARFEAERQALALMEHPHIARVLDAGATDTGRPYFVMEYVIGDSITHFADAHKLNVRQRLELFSQVCQAVQHAHTKGVIHRDIKPGNILVSMSDGKPFAKVIDFGIAKATAAPLTDKTLFTEHRQLIGTPEYMSPEQAEGSADIDTRTDVYALGVLLYELLTGLTPFDGARLRSAAWIEMQRIIREEDPPAPSIRLTRDLNKLAAIAAARHVEPSALSTQIKGELDWIVMKALDKDRARRYETPNQLSADVQRHLAGEAVVAAPVSKAYRLRKFVRRNKGAALSTGAVLLSLTAGTSIAGWQWLYKTRAYEDLKAQAETMMSNTADLLNTTLPLAPGTTNTVSAPLEGNLSLHIVRKASPSGPDVTTRLFVGTRQELSERLSTLLVEPQEYIEPSRVAMALSQEVRTATARLRDSTTEAEWSAYTANLALAKIAMDSDNWPEARERVANCPVSKRGWEWKFVDLKSKSIAWAKEVQHAGSYTAFSPDGSKYAVGLGNIVNVYDSNTQLLIDEVRVHDRDVRCISFSPDSTQIVTAGFDHTARLWNASTRDRILEFKGHKEYLTSVAFSHDGQKILTTSEDHTARLWDARTEKCIRVLERHKGAVYSGAFSPDDAQVVTASYDKTAIVWDVASGSCRTVFTGHAKDTYVVSAMFNPDGTKIVSTSGNANSLMWDAATGTTIMQFSGNREVGRPVSFNPAGTMFVSTTGDGAARVFDVATGTCMAMISRYTNETPVIPSMGGTHHGITSASFSHDGSQIIVESRERGYGKMFRCAFESTAPGAFASADEYTFDDLAEVRWPVRLGLTSAKQTQTNSITLADGSRRIVGGADRSVRFIDPDTNREIAVFAMPSAVTALQMSADETRLAIYMADGTARFWDIRDTAERLNDAYAAFAERVPAGTYLDALWAGPTPTAELRKSIESDLSLSPLRRLTALELLPARLETCDRDVNTAYYALTQDQVEPDAVRAAALAAELPPRVKQRVVASLKDWKPEAKTCHEVAWRLAEPGPMQPDVARNAVKYARAAVAASPTDGEYVRTLGAALYRLGEFKEALETLGRSDILRNTDGSGPFPSNLAFTAMTLYKLGEAEKAKATLSRLRELLSDPATAANWVNNPKVSAYLNEAETLIDPASK